MSGNNADRMSRTNTHVRRKRPRQQSFPTHLPAQPPPAPPPIPPKSLISLIRANKSVLQYFTSLQENLEYDVKKWKIRAQQAERKLKELQNEPTKVPCSFSQKDKEQIHNHENDIEIPKIVERKQGKKKKKRLKKIVRHENNHGDTDSVASSLSDSIFPPNLKQSFTTPSCKKTNPKIITSINSTANKKNISTSKHNKQSDIDEQKKSDALIDEYFDTDSSSREKSLGDDVEFNMNISNRKDHRADINKYEFHREKSGENENLSNFAQNFNDKQINYTKEKKSELTFQEKEEFQLMMIAHQCFCALGISLVEKHFKEIKLSDGDDVDRTHDDKLDEKSNDSSIKMNENGEIINKLKTQMKKRGNDNVEVLVQECNQNVANDNSIDQIITETNVQILIEPKKDNMIIAEVLQCMRALIKMKNISKQNKCKDAYEFQPFMSFNLIPCCFSRTKRSFQVNEIIKSICDVKIRNKDFSLAQLHREGQIKIDENSNKYNNYDEHPAAKGLSILLKALFILDTLNDAIMSTIFTKYQQQQTKILKPRMKSHDQIIDVFIGIRNRSKLVAKLVRALDEEIGFTWASMDRDSRLVQPAVYFLACEKKIEDEGVGTDSNSQMNVKTKQCDDSQHRQNSKTISSVRSQNRLVSLAEKSLCASIISNVYLHVYHDPQMLFELVMNYIRSSVPAMSIDCHPMLPPVMSFVVLEALIHSGNVVDNLAMQKNPSNSRAGDWFHKRIDMFENVKLDKQERNVLGKAVSLAFFVAYIVWEERSSQCVNDRVYDLAFVELAAYKRLIYSFMIIEKPWFVEFDIEKKKRNEFVYDTGLDILRLSLEVFDEIEHSKHDLATEQMRYTNNFNESVYGEGAFCTGNVLAIELSLLVLSNNNLVHQLCYSKMTKLSEYVMSSKNEKKDLTHIKYHLITILISVKVHCSLRLYQLHAQDLKLRVKGELLDYQRLKSLRINSLGYHAEINFGFSFLILEQMREEFLSSGALESKEVFTAHDWQLISTLFQCAVLLCDGSFAYRMAKWLVSAYNKILNNTNGRSVDEDRDVCKHVEKIFETKDRPLVRVINLRRRPDRLRKFVLQAQREQVMVVRGVIPLGKKSFPCPWLKQMSNANDDAFDDEIFLEHEVSHIPHEQKFWGDFAYDGAGSLEDFEKRVSQMFENDYSYLKRKLVESHWRPHDLKAFDQGAKNNDSLVRSSPTERACALSHISCWRGVERTLIRTKKNTTASNDTKIFTDDRVTTFEFLLQISGFASGRALLVENENMDPSPVCVILEDDAILHDQFSIHLEYLLKELPRDFHFCSLGYSRPKAAPMLDYSPMLGIPSCLWYLTGYIVSLEGVKYLQSCLPVVGPVDSWLGLKMCSNWENKLGFEIGVGLAASKARKTNLTRKELISVLKFRCFAALSPLCSQSIGDGELNSEGIKQSWRNRDSDIVYSGNF